MHYQILIIFGMNITDTTVHQMTVYVPASPKVCFCTTWENRTSKILHFYLMQYHYLISNNTHLAHFIQIFSTLADSLFNCAAVQLLTVNIQNIRHLCELGDAFLMR